MRLDRLLVTVGLGSRTQVQRLIRSGAVAVDGQTLRDPGSQIREDAAVAVSGQAVDTRQERHILLNKPAGVLTAARDSRQETVMSLLPPAFTSLGCMPVGRLDKDTTGLLLLTTDGEMAHRLLSPARYVDKVYLAEVDGPLTAAHIEAFAAGLNLGDFVAAPAALDILESGEARALARVTVHEGRFHQVKRMFEAVGRTVLTLRRERFGPLTLPEDLTAGQWRELTGEELAEVRRAVGMEAER